MDKKWIEKYAPTSIDDMCLEQGLKDMFNAYLADGDVPNMTLAGRPGIGKTTLAWLLAKHNENNTDLFVSASEDNGIDIIKKKVREFVDMCTFEGGLKVVILDEADGLSKNSGGNGSSAQDALRNLMESDLEDTRFILTCNGKDRLIPALHSRNPIIEIKYDITQVCKRVLHILKEENITLSDTDKVEIVKCVKKKFPDIRQIIGIMQNCCVTGKFDQSLISHNEGINTTIEYIKAHINNPRKCREYWIENANSFGSDYLELAGAFFNLFDGSNVDNLLMLSEKYYQLNCVVDVEIGFYSMVLTANKNKAL